MDQSWHFTSMGQNILKAVRADCDHSHPTTVIIKTLQLVPYYYHPDTMLQCKLKKSSSVE